MKQLHHLSQSIENKEIEICFKLINEIKLLSLKDKQKKSFTSLIIKFYLITNKNESIKDLVYSDITLMKRDYLLYCNLIYNSDKDEAIDIFVNKILPNELLLQKDIDFIIDNKLYKLLEILDGYYINCTKKSNVFDFSKLRKYGLDKSKKEEIIKYYKELIPNKYYDEFISKLSGADVILDGGNISFNNSGKLDYKYIENVFKNTLLRYKKPLFIIHKRHEKSKNPIIKQFLNKFNENIYLTPYNFYDDYFLIFGIIYNDINIITNDLFKDHIFEMFKLFESKNNQIKNYLTEKILNYNRNFIKDELKYSNCIQYIDGNLYIPTIDNNFFIFQQ